jgi:TolA-binding protein
VRRKTLSGGRYMNICFIGGKSYAGEVHSKKESSEVPYDNTEEVTEEMSEFTEDLSLIFNIKEKSSVDKDKRTVTAAFLQENIMSANGRFYPAETVRGAIHELEGKKSFIGHDTNDARDIVAVIRNPRMEGPLAVADFHFGCDEISEMMFQKIAGGLVDSTSIRAAGKTRRAKMGEKFVDVVRDLKIGTIDWVPEGGIKTARVLKVFETAPEFKEIDAKEENNMAGEELKQLQEQVDSLIKKVEELKGEIKEKDLEIKKRDDETRAAKLAAFKETKLATVPDEETRTLIREQLTGDSEEKITDQFEKQVKYFKAIREKAGLSDDDVVINPADKKDKKTKQYRNYNELLEDESVPREVRAKIISKKILL